MSWLSKGWNDFTGRSATEDAFNRAQDRQQQLDAEQKAIAAEQQRKLREFETQRQNNIGQGKSAIETAFSQFGDPYYDTAAKAYTNAYLPQIDQQLRDAQGKLTAQLAGRGILESSVGANKLARLNETAAGARSDAATQGIDFANQQRGSVDQAKSRLYQDNLSGADPNAISARATGDATSLAQMGANSAPPRLGNLFGSFLAPFANFAQANNNSPNPWNPFGSPSGGGSSRVIG